MTDELSAEPAAPLAIATGSPILTQCSLTVEGVTGTAIGLGFSTLPGNLATSYQNAVALWQGSIVAWNASPQTKETVPVDEASADFTFSPVSITRQAYTVGYAVGPRLGDFCACVTIGAGGQATNPQAVGLNISWIGATSLTLAYVTLPGYQPQANGNWAGLWQGQVDAFAPGTPVAQVPVSADTDQGPVVFNNVPLLIGTTYTVVYFMGPEPTTAAAQLTFTTATAVDTPTPAADEAEEELTWRLTR
jgi:hypothetical protein